MLCVFTNYYTAATWYGYDINEEVTGSTNYAGKIWAAAMSKIHSGKESSKFAEPSGIVRETICKTWTTNSSSVTNPPTTYCTTHTEETAYANSVPVITLKGEAHITLNVGETYTEAGATASDEKDGDLSSKISMSGTVNTSKAGIYEISYTI